MRNIKHKRQNPLGSAKGFSLPEMAFVMIISGILFTIAFNVYKNVLRVDTLDTVFENTRTMEGALTEFKSITGRYPCPADPTLPPGDPGYGLENCGINIIATTRDANGDTVNDNILIGSFPFDTVLPVLNNSDMAAINAFDPWGNKFTYAVTENLTDATTYNDFWGTIRVVDEFDQSVIDPPDRAHLVLISHGENGRNGYSAQGQLIDPFVFLPPGGPPPPPPPPGTPLLNESENADGDGIFLSGLYNTNDAFRNDDFTSFMISQTTRLWQIVGADTSFSPPLFLVSNINPGNVGVGIPDPTERLEVAGNVKSPEFRASRFCDEAGTDCMPISRLAGNDPEMSCDNPGEAVVAFANNEKVCASAFSGPVATTCDPATEYMNGFSNLGNAICFPR